MPNQFRKLLTKDSSKLSDVFGSGKKYSHDTGIKDLRESMIGLIDTLMYVEHCVLRRKNYGLDINRKDVWIMSKHYNDLEKEISSAKELEELTKWYKKLVQMTNKFVEEVAQQDVEILYDDKLPNRRDDGYNTHRYPNSEELRRIDTLEEQINQEVDKLRKKLKEISKKMEKMVRMMTEQAECSADFHDIKTIIEREKKRTQRKKKMYDRYVTVKPHGEVTMSR